MKKNIILTDNIELKEVWFKAMEYVLDNLKIDKMYHFTNNKYFLRYSIFKKGSDSWLVCGKNFGKNNIYTKKEFLEFLYNSKIKNTVNESQKNENTDYSLVNSKEEKNIFIFCENFIEDEKGYFCKAKNENLVMDKNKFIESCYSCKEFVPIKPDELKNVGPGNGDYGGAYEEANYEGDSLDFWNGRNDDIYDFDEEN